LGEPDVAPSLACREKASPKAMRHPSQRSWLMYVTVFILLIGIEQ
jgi:hypothetical protein